MTYNDICHYDTDSEESENKVCVLLFKRGVISFWPDYGLVISYMVTT